MINKWLYLSQGITLGLFLFFQCDHVKKRSNKFEVLACKKVTQPIQHLSFVGAPHFPIVLGMMYSKQNQRPNESHQVHLIELLHKKLVLAFLTLFLSFSIGEAGMYNTSYYRSIEEQLKQRQGIDITSTGNMRAWFP